jgi:hypothetical protein
MRSTLDGESGPRKQRKPHRRTTTPENLPAFTVIPTHYPRKRQ